MGGKILRALLRPVFGPKRVAKAEGAVGGFGHLQKLLIISERRTLRACHLDQNPGWSREGLSASAL